MKYRLCEFTGEPSEDNAITLAILSETQDAIWKFMLLEDIIYDIGLEYCAGFVKKEVNQK